MPARLSTGRRDHQSDKEIKDLPQCKKCEGPEDCAKPKASANSDGKRPSPQQYYRLQRTFRDVKYLVRVLLAMLIIFSLYFLAIISRFIKRGGVELQDEDEFGDEWAATDTQGCSSSQLFGTMERGSIAESLWGDSVCEDSFTGDGSPGRHGRMNSMRDFGSVSVEMTPPHKHFRSGPSQWAPAISERTEHTEHTSRDG